jgi:hypothetical protein
MKIKIWTQNGAFLLFILCYSFNAPAISQGINQKIVSAKTIELDQGCKIVFDANFNTTEFVSKEIVNGIRNILPQVQKLIPADSIEIKINISNDVMPTLGVAGRSISAYSLIISFDPKNPNYKPQNIPPVLVHELHHLSRHRMKDWKLSLPEAMIMEGLADHFTIEVINSEPPVWSHVLTNEEIKKYLIKLSPYLNLTFESWYPEFNQKYYAPWMFGRTGSDPIPRWTGYTLGWTIVENYIKTHSGALASNLVWTPTKTIISSTPELVNSKQP